MTTAGAQPFTPVPLTNRTAPAYGFADNLRNPYIQVFNASIQRELTRYADPGRKLHRKQVQQAPN